MWCLIVLHTIFFFGNLPKEIYANFSKIDTRKTRHTMIERERETDTDS